MGRNLPRPVWLILSIALLVRVAVVLATPGYELHSDAAEYDRVARSLAAGDGYPGSILVPEGGPSAFTPPGYPLALLPVYAASDGSVMAARLIQAFIGTVLVGLIGRLAVRLINLRVGLLAMALAAVAPFLLVADQTLAAEPLTSVFVLGAILSVLALRDSGQFKWAIAAGLLAGFAVLTRSNAIIILLPLAGAVWFSTPKAKTVAVTALLLAAVLVNTPWAVRNALATDSFVPLSTRFGVGLIRIYNEQARVADPPSVPADGRKAREIYRTPGLTEIEADRKYRAAALEYIRDNPEHVLATYGRNFLRTFQLRDGPLLRQSIGPGSGVEAPAWLANSAFLAFYPFLILAMLGLVSAFRQMPWYVWVTPVLLLASSMHFSGIRLRYQWPIDPFVVLFAAGGVLILWSWWQGRRSDPDGRPPAVKP